MSCVEETISTKNVLSTSQSFGLLDSLPQMNSMNN